MSRHSRAAARDYWTSPRAVQIARRLDTAAAWTVGTALTALIMFAGSLNFQ